MIVTIISVRDEFTQSGSPYKKLEVVDGAGKQTTKAVFNNLEEKWPLLEEGKTLEFKMQKRGQYWNVMDITVPELPPKGEEKMPPEHKGGIEQAMATLSQEFFDNNRDRDGLPLSVKIRTFAVSYAKDFACSQLAAGQKEVNMDTIIKAAVQFAAYMALGPRNIHK